LEQVTAVGTSSSSVGGARTSVNEDQPQVGLIARFTSLSQQEFDEIENSFEVFSDQIREELVQIANQLRPGEGKLFKKTVDRYKSILQPVTSAAEGVRTPLDAVHNSQDQLEIWIPENLESHADSATLAELLRYKAHIPGVKLTRCNGTLPENESGNWFIMGYITELLSDQVIKHIKYNKDSIYTLGRACARVKLLMACVDQTKIPSKYLHIPERFLGGISQFKEPEITRALKTFYEATDAEHIGRLLQILTTHVVRVKGVSVRAKMDVSLFLNPEAVVNMSKRRVSHTEKTARGKSKTVTETVSPTKPSQLATVTPWERDAVTELFEKAWIDEKKLVSEFGELRPLDRNYIEFSKQLTKLFETQWGQKQVVLKKTQHRLAAYPGDKGDQLYKKLNWARTTFSQWGSIEAVPGDLISDYDPANLVAVGVYHHGGQSIPALTFLRSEPGRDAYPQMGRLFDSYEKVTSGDDSEESE